MRRTLRKKGISLLSPFGEILLYTCPSSPLFLYTHTRTTKTKTKTTISTSVRIYRGAAKHTAVFLRGLLESANKDTVLGKKKRNPQRKLMDKNHTQKRVPFSLFFSILNPKLENPFCFKPYAWKPLFFFPTPTPTPTLSLVCWCWCLLVLFVVGVVGVVSW